MFLALLRKAVNDELGTWCGANRDAIERANVGERLGGVDPVKLVAWNLHGTP